MDHPLILDPNEVTESNIPLVDDHLHTNWTDGEQPVVAVHEQAVACGLTSILFSEHARKTSVDWFGTFAAEVRALPKDQCHAFVGVEVKIEDNKGNLDIVPAIAGECDLVMASVHRFPDADGQAIPFADVAASDAPRIEMELSLAALNKPCMDILGHPFGMSYRRFDTAPSREMLKAVIAAAAKNDVAIEINSYYHPDPWQMIALCRDAGARITLGSNAHNQMEVGRIVRMLKETRSAWTAAAS